MLEVSCRENFNSTTRFSTHNVPTGHYPENQKVLVVVHGFSADMDKVRKRYLELEDQCETSGSFDSVVGFFWPGSWTHALGYINADRRAEEAGKFLAALLFELVERNNTVTVEAHSLGCKVSLFASTWMKPNEIERWVFFAPAVPNNVLEYFPQFITSARNYPRIYYSKDDGVLKYAFRMVPYNWKRPALGYSGPDPKDSRLQTTDMTGIVKDHSGYMVFAVKLCV